MYFELNCSCTACIIVDVRQGREDAAWLLINRFTAAHAACGFVSPLPDDTDVAETRSIFYLNINNWRES